MKLSVLLCTGDTVSTISNHNLIGDIDNLKIEEECIITENENFTLVIKGEEVVFESPFVTVDGSIVKIQTKGTTRTIFMICK